MTNNSPQPIYSVSELNRQIKLLVEDRFPFIWLTGEISNFSRPASGHCYFTLKDSNSQISAVLFRGQCRNLKFLPENGMKVKGFGRVAIYEPRGNYQIIFEYLEPQGSGALQAAFEQLKIRLSNEGVFDSANKLQLPFIPMHVSIITSPTGAVIHDFLKVALRRFPNARITLFPCTVQGGSAAVEIVNAIGNINKAGVSDLIVIARGGGSMEDLQPFNEEILAREIFASEIPVVSAIGHETDYTICDFSADLRAPTPSAAAEIIFPEKILLEKRLYDLDYALKSGFKRYLYQRRFRLDELSRRVIHPRRRIGDLRLKTDDLLNRLIRTFGLSVKNRMDQVRWRTAALYAATPAKTITENSQKNHRLKSGLVSSARNHVHRSRMRLNELTGTLSALNPRAILDRGYSITRTIPQSSVVSDASDIQEQVQVEVLLSKGSLRCRVEEIMVEEVNIDGKKNI